MKNIEQKNQMMKVVFYEDYSNNTMQQGEKKYGWRQTDL